MQLYIKLNLKVICCFLFQQERFKIELYIQLLHTPSLSSSSISLSHMPGPSWRILLCVRWKEKLRALQYMLLRLSLDMSWLETTHLYKWIDVRFLYTNFIE